MLSLLWLTLPWLSLGCTSDDASKDSVDSAPARCPADTLPPGQVEVLAAGFDLPGTSGTEGIAFSPDGRLFVGGSSLGDAGYVAEVQPDGSWTELAPLPGSVGLAWWRDQLVVASSAEDGGVVGVDINTGATTQLGGGIPGSNFPLPSPWGSLLVATHAEDSVFELNPEGETSVWVSGVPSPNGLAFDAAGEWLYLANTYGTPSDVGRVAVTGEASGDYEVVATLQDGATQDGAAIDADGDVYIALNVPGEIVRVSPSGETELVAEGVDWAASIAFGVGEGWDPCSLYATSLFSDVVFRVGVGVPGPSAN